MDTPARPPRDPKFIGMNLGSRGGGEHGGVAVKFLGFPPSLGVMTSFRNLVRLTATAEHPGADPRWGGTLDTPRGCHPPEFWGDFFFPVCPLPHRVPVHCGREEVRMV